MAFQNRNLSVIAYANGFTMWNYKDFNESLESMCAEDFFAPVKDLMACGDLIICVVQDTVQTMYVKTINPLTLKKQGE